MPCLRLSFLGSFHAEAAGEPLDGFRSQKVKALLAYLATEPERPHPRAALASLLWPELPQRCALDNLRNALWNLRVVSGDRQADPPHLLVSRQAIRLNPAGEVDVDVQRFLQFCGEPPVTFPRGDAAGSRELVERLEQAVALYRGEFLEDFSVDSAPFEEWASLQREALRRQLLQALHELGRYFERACDWQRALSHTMRQTEVDPWDERAQRRAMRLLARQGRRGAALARYDACRRVLLEELGVEPMPETVRLFERIRQGEALLDEAV